MHQGYAYSIRAMCIWPAWDTSICTRYFSTSYLDFEYHLYNTPISDVSMQTILWYKQPIWTLGITFRLHLRQSNSICYNMYIWLRLLVISVIIDAPRLCIYVWDCMCDTTTWTSFLKTVSGIHFRYIQPYMIQLKYLDLGPSLEYISGN
jgi:hypothetical protein